MSEGLAPRGQEPRRRRWIPAAAVGAYFLVESLLPAQAQPSAWLVRGSIGAYRAVASPLLKASGVRCRFEPSCSCYGALAVERHGTLSGIALTALRIGRCAPWGPPPGEDLP